MRTLSARITIVLVLSFLCPSFSTYAEGKPKFPKNALSVPITPQATDYSCGAAAILSVLVYWRSFEGYERELYSLLDTTPKDGTAPEKIAEVARAYGLQATLKTGMTIKDLREALASGYTVILDIQAWHETKGPNWKNIWDDGHYVVLVGMDEEYAYVMDPSTKTSYTYLPLSELLDRWHDYEDRTGTVVRNFQLGITISGEKNISSFPYRLIRLE